MVRPGCPYDGPRVSYADFTAVRIEQLNYRLRPIADLDDPCGERRLRARKGRVLHDARMPAVVREPKTFNNLSGFERGLWQRRLRRNGYVPKTSVFGRVGLRTYGLQRHIFLNETAAQPFGT